MRKFFRIFLAAVYIATTFTVLVGQTEAAGEELGSARSSASPVQSQTDVHWASDPHFSHAKKTGSGVEFSPILLLWFAITSAAVFQRAVRSANSAFQHPRPARAPPLRF